VAALILHIGCEAANFIPVELKLGRSYADQ